MPADVSTNAQSHSAPRSLRQRLWQTTFGRDVLPFLTSLALHAAVLGVGVLTIQAVRVVMRTPQYEIQVADETEGGVFDVVPDAIPGEQDLEGRYRGTEHDPSLRPLQSDDPTALPNATGWNERRGIDWHSFDKAYAAEATDAAVPDRFIGLPGGSLAAGRIAGPDGAVGSRGDGGPLAAFGPRGRAGGSRDIFTPQIATSRNNWLRSVAYVCDASGSMTARFDELRDELAGSIGNLAPVQRFNVFFFQDGKAATIDPANLLPATSQNKRLAGTFLADATTSGTTDPIPAIDAALRQKPQVMFLLTDGDFPDNAAVLEFIRRKNADRATTIHTIAFLERDESYEQVLRTIAQENGGTFKYVGEEQLGR